MDQLIMSGLTGHLDTGNCILVLGPEFINMDREDQPHGSSIVNYLAESRFKQYNSAENYLTEDGFYFFDMTDAHQKLKRQSILMEAARFYRSLEVSESYGMLAQVPFDAVISLSPDKLLEKACKDIGKQTLYRKYTAAGFQDIPGETLSENRTPVIYNLCGDAEGTNDLLFTFDNLFKFFDKLFQAGPFNNFQLRIQNALSFIFLGFTYDKWYLKLIFYFIKKMHGSADNDETKYAILDIDKSSANQRLDFFVSHFKMVFSSENEKLFIKDLYNACQKEKLLFSDQASKQEDEEDEDAAGRRYKIMYLSSSPKDKTALHQGREYSKITGKLRLQYFDALEPVFDCSADSLRSHISHEDPNMVFISCHGARNNSLILSNKDDNSAELTLASLQEIINHLTTKHRRLECIVFSSCQSEVQAKAISNIIPYAIGMREPILEDASDLFTAGFFEGFLRKRSDLPYAFRNGILKLKACPLEGVTYEDFPVLYHKGELLPSTLQPKNLGV